MVYRPCKGPPADCVFAFEMSVRPGLAHGDTFLSQCRCHGLWLESTTTLVRLSRTLIGGVTRLSDVVLDLSTDVFLASPYNACRRGCKSPALHLPLPHSWFSESFKRLNVLGCDPRRQTEWSIRDESSLSRRWARIRISNCRILSCRAGVCWHDRFFHDCRM